MSLLDPVLVVKVIGFGGFLWLGIYIVSRAATQTPLTIVSMLGMFSQASFFFSSAIIANNTIGLGTDGGSTVTRGFWWSNVLAMAFWFHMSILIARPPRQRSVFSWPVVVVYLAGIFCSVAGSLTDLFLDYTHIMSTSNNGFYIGTSPGYLFFLLYLLVAGAGAFYNLLRARNNTRRSEVAGKQALVNKLNLLVVGSLLFVAGALWLAGSFYFGLGYPELPANSCLVLGLCFLGYGVAHFDMLVEGQNVQRDFIYSFTGTALICLLYVIFVSLTGGNSTLNVLVVVGLAIISHSTFDFTRGLLDKFFFSSNEQTARSEARAYATAIASQPTSAPELEEAIAAPVTLVSAPELNEASAEPISSSQPETHPDEPNVTEKSFNDMVRKAITGLKSPPQMIKSPLLSLRTVERRLHENSLEDNRLNRASVLREMLVERIERLRPAGSDSNGTGDAWRFYNVLYYPYVRDISRKSALTEVRRLQDARRRNGQREPGELESVLEWLVDVDEDTFYKWQRKASDTIAAILREEELKLQETNRDPIEVAR